jgi:hypothetical protein
MNWEQKALLTAMTVALVLIASRMFGQRIGGLCAGLPVVSALTLAWLNKDLGFSFAAQSATGIVTASGASAAFIISYEWLSKRWPATVAFPVSLVPAILLSFLVASLHVSSTWIFAASIALCIVGLAWLKDRQVLAVPPPQSTGASVIICVMAAGLISAIVTSQSVALGPFHSGLLAALPIAGATIIINQHLTVGRTSIPCFARGYIAGLAGQATFAEVFSLAIGPNGAGITLALSLVASVTVAAIATRAAAKPKRYRPFILSGTSRPDLRDKIIY